MNVLMGKVQRTSGQIYVNEQKIEISALRNVIGYVPQEDIMVRELTVRENLLHSARIRLPRTWSTQQIEEHVDSIIDSLG